MPDGNRPADLDDFLDAEIQRGVDKFRAGLRKPRGVHLPEKDKPRGQPEAQIQRAIVGDCRRHLQNGKALGYAAGSAPGAAELRALGLRGALGGRGTGRADPPRGALPRGAALRSAGATPLRNAVMSDIPEARAQLAEIGMELELLGLHHLARQVGEVRDMMHRRPYARERAPARSVYADATMAAEIRQMARTYPTMTLQAIAEAHGVNAGRVSEALQGLR
jgi:hypothetical protein